MENHMTISKEEKNLNMPWEKEYGYSQAVKVGDTIYLSGQISHNETGEIVGVGDVEAQIRQTYVNIKKLLAEYGAGLENVVDETWFVTDIEAGDAVAGKLRKEIYSGIPVVALTVVEIKRLAFPELLVEIKCVAKV
ncbi:MAG TPA: RidA family protein [Pyrinomonadaceae bacterium]|nr:RidA family protein [Pyrinomonadaceae bacterium]